MSDRMQLDFRREAHGSRLRCIVVLVTALLLTPLWADAYMVAMTPQDLTNRAELIVEGSVADVTTKELDIEVTIRIQHLIKGSADGQVIRIRYPRGLEDMPEFMVGEHVLLFLARATPDAWQVVGGMQGKVSLGKEK